MGTVASWSKPLVTGREGVNQLYVTNRTRAAGSDL